MLETCNKLSSNGTDSVFDGMDLERLRYQIMNEPIKYPDLFSVILSHDWWKSMEECGWTSALKRPDKNGFIGNGFYCDQGIVKRYISRKIEE